MFSLCTYPEPVFRLLRRPSSRCNASSWTERLSPLTWTLAQFRTSTCTAFRPKSITPVFPQLPRSKSVTTSPWQVVAGKSPLSAVSRRFPNPCITTTCCQLVADLLATWQTMLTCQDNLPCRQQVRNKVATSTSMGKLRGNVSDGL